MFRMDIAERLKDPLERMVRAYVEEDETDNDRIDPKKNYWLFDFFSIRDDFRRVSDHDAKDIIPEIAAVFEAVQKMVIEADLTPKKRSEALYQISSLRKTFGIDKRARDIAKA